MVKNSKSKLPSFIRKDGVRFTEAIANAFNSFFANAGCFDNRQTTECFRDYLKSSVTHFLFLSPTDRNGILKLSSSLKNKHERGVDDMSPYVIKKLISYIVKPLTHVFNLSFMSGTFPESMKVSKVTPLCKKGDIHDLSNYRPISLLSTFSKILERLMYNRLSTCLHKHSIIFFGTVWVSKMLFNRISFTFCIRTFVQIL